MYDIEIFTGRDKTTIRGLTSKGQLWMLQNLSSKADILAHGRIRVDNEFAADVIDFIKKNSGTTLIKYD